jgi:hypothetical protein
MGLLAKNCGIKGGYDAIRKMVKDQDGRDRYMDAQMAVDFGIVDYVGIPKVGRVKLYQVEATNTGKSKPKKTKKSESKRSSRRGAK